MKLTYLKAESELENKIQLETTYNGKVLIDYAHPVIIKNLLIDFQDYLIENNILLYGFTQNSIAKSFIENKTK